MCRILVVDDDPDFVEITRTILTKEGFEVLSATSGDDALKVVQEERPEIVLLDIMMSTVLDGLNVSQKIREDEELRDTRVIMVTSIMDTDKAELFPTDEYVPVDAWMTKPVDPNKLIQTIKKYCTHQKAGQRQSMC